MNDRAFYAFVWWPVFLLAQVAALGVVLAVDPAGFDACQAVASTSTRVLQGGIAAGVIVGAALLAAWRLNGWLLVAALAPVAIAAVLWVLLLGGPQNC